MKKPFAWLAGPLLAAILLAGCGTATPTTTPVPPPTPTAAASQPQVDLGAVKKYLLDTAGTLKQNTAAVKAAADEYYTLVAAGKFDYATLVKDKHDDMVRIINTARTAWIAASPGYEKVEGIVAGTPSLADYDVIIDAGSSAAQGGDNVAPFDLTLPDGKVLAKPGNLFGVTESTLWGTFADYRVPDVQLDLNGDGKMDFGDTVPDANILKAGADALDSYTGEMLAAGQAWEPTLSDAFTALVVMVPTMSEYFESWKHSRFVSGNASTQRDFVVISRLADIGDILSGLEVIYGQLQPLAATTDKAQAEQIGQRLNDLKTFVGGVYSQEQGGKHFAAEEADQLGEEAQNRATAIAGQISQIAAQLNVKLEGA